MLALTSSFFANSKLYPYFSLSPSKHTKSTTEPKKIIVSSAIKKALRHCIVHIIPVLGSVAILTLNFHGTYVGADFDGLFASETLTLMGLQVAAKIHEIFIVSSLGLIVVDVIRHELLYGGGLPLGLIGSGLSFGTFNFFLKREFRGSLRYIFAPGQRLRKASILALLSLAGILAALVGPSSATLMVPRSQTWPAGATEFFLNGSSDQLWPSDLSSDLADLERYCSNNTSSSLGICPAGGFLSLREHWGRMNYTNFQEYDVPAYAKKLTGSRFYWPVHSPASPIPPVYALGNPRTLQDVGSYTFLVQSHVATATLVHRIATDWWAALESQLSLSDSQVDDRNVWVHALAAITSIRCAEPRNMSKSENTVHFPGISGRFDYNKGEEFVVNSLDETAVDHLRFQWVHLPPKFGAVSIGGVFESPWDMSSNSRVVVGCSAQAGWVPSRMITDEYTFWSGYYPWGIDWGGRTPAWTQIPEGQAQSPTNGRIAVGRDWLNLLTPPVSTVSTTGSGDSSWVPSTLESILDNSGVVADLLPQNGGTLTQSWTEDQHTGIDRTSFLEAIICSVLVDGLSRSGSYRAFHTTGPISTWSLAAYDPLPDFAPRIVKGKTALQRPDSSNSDITTLQAKMEITGFSIRGTLAGYLSAMALSTHLAMVVVHLIWTLLRKRTSSSWESISELIALSQNSRPAYTALGNTAAGIRRGQTYSQVGKIRIRPLADSIDNEHVELVFEESGVQLADLPLSLARHESRHSQHGAENGQREPSDDANDPGNNGRHPPGNEVDLESGRALRGGGVRTTWTWPHNLDDGMPRDQSLLNSTRVTNRRTPQRMRSESTETLIAKSSIRRESLGDLVQVDREYG